MKSFLLLLLRLSLLALVFLPVYKPTVRSENEFNIPVPVTLFATPNIERNLTLDAALTRKLKEHFGKNLNFEWRVFGQPENSSIEDFEDLGMQISTAKGSIVIFSDPLLWGPAARKFNQKLRKTAAWEEGRISWISPAEFMKTGSLNASRFLGLSDVFLPKLSFLGEESIASIEIQGIINPNEKYDTEIVLRSGDALLTSRTVSLVADAQGIIDTVIPVPVHFVKAATQIITANLNSPLAASTLSSASTSVTVMHSKTTILHIGVGPDWSLRNLRQKLKFWPNLDLLSYYILREASDDMSIPSSQLSLIEFPSEKLFGTELPNFHGVVAQNFLFDQYLNPRDSENLIQYVRNGGRMVLMAGPLSFVSRDPSILALSPCKNTPELDLKNVYHWDQGSTRLSANNDFQNFIKEISSHATAIGCEPKEGSIVLARTKEGDHPVMIAQPLDKGLVLTLLAGDWHTYYTQVEVKNEASRARRIITSEATEHLFQWMVEFLQRRQDSGLRPPDLSGPRLYDGDNFFLVNARGPLRLDSSLMLIRDGTTESEGQSMHLPFLDTDAARFNQNLSGTTPKSGLNVLNSVAQAAVPRKTALHLEFKGDPSPVKRPGIWPLFNGTSKQSESIPNPIVFKDIPSFSNGTSLTSVQQNASHSQQEVPLLKAYPWLLALLLCLFALEQFLSHYLWDNRKN